MGCSSMLQMIQRFLKTFDAHGNWQRFSNHESVTTSNRAANRTSRAPPRYPFGGGKCSPGPRPATRQPMSGRVRPAVAAPSRPRPRISPRAACSSAPRRCCRSARRPSIRLIAARRHAARHARPGRAHAHAVGGARARPPPRHGLRDHRRRRRLAAQAARARRLDPRPRPRTPACRRRRRSSSSSRARRCAPAWRAASRRAGFKVTPCATATEALEACTRVAPRRDRVRRAADRTA